MGGRDGERHAMMKREAEENITKKKTEEEAKKDDAVTKQSATGQDRTRI